MNQSNLHLHMPGASITIQIRANLPRKTRRALLLTLFKTAKLELKHLMLCKLYHLDEPLSTTISTMIRGTVGNDAILRATQASGYGYLIRILRTKLGYTQKTFAKSAGVSQSLISLIEHGKYLPNPDILHLMETLVCSPPSEVETSNFIH